MRIGTVEQSLRYSAGVQTEVNGYDLRYSSLLVRDFAPVELLDGFRLPTSGGFSGWLVEPQGMERIELLKGPGAVLYDQTATGGIVNMVSKRPTTEAVREVALSVGSRDRYQGSFDLSGSLSDDDSLLFRLNGVLRNSGGQTDFSRDDRSFIAPALTWKPTSRTTITLLADATRDRMTPKSAWPQDALIAPNPNGRVPVNCFTGEPGVDHYNRESSSLTYLLEHRLGDDWTFRQKARYSALDIDYLQLQGAAFRSDMRTLDRSVLLWRDRIRVAMLDNQIEHRFRTGPLVHTLPMGVDYRRYTSNKETSVGAAPAIDVFAPVYGAPVAVPGIELRSTDGVTQFGLCVQDQMRSGPWSLDLAVRHDRARNHLAAGPLEIGSADDHKTTYNAGLLYLAPSGLAPYAW